VDVEGDKEGQINGLAVYSVGDYSFGRPSRITARTFLGRKGVINIEREAKLSGKTHSKGVLILGGYFSGHYAKDHPLSLSASLGFEQTYGEIDGDSASAAELITILSSLTGIPIKQGLAITGSINQHGDIQPIGGVNEKVEGFFAVCSSKGLNGEQGVIIPQQNVKNLVLKKEVVKAVEEGKFHVYSVKHIDEAIELLTGTPAGKISKDGTFPKGTLNYLVQKELIAMDKKLKKSEGSKGK
jgi:ATP-dependent Lon protease